MTDPKYLPYDFDISPSETWRERPVTLSITTATPTGSGSMTVTLDYDEMRRLSAHLLDYLNHFGPDTDPA